MEHKIKVIVYSKQGCPNCEHAKRWLTGMVDFEVQDITGDVPKMMDLAEESGCRSFPFIRVGDKLIGGFDKVAVIDELEKAKNEKK